MDILKVIGENTKTFLDLTCENKKQLKVGLHDLKRWSKMLCRNTRRQQTPENAALVDWIAPQQRLHQLTSILDTYRTFLSPFAWLVVKERLRDLQRNEPKIKLHNCWSCQSLGTAKRTSESNKKSTRRSLRTQIKTDKSRLMPRFLWLALFDLKALT